MPESSTRGDSSTRILGTRAKSALKVAHPLPQKILENELMSTTALTKQIEISQFSKCQWVTAPLLPVAAASSPSSTRARPTRCARSATPRAGNRGAPPAWMPTANSSPASGGTATTHAVTAVKSSKKECFLFLFFLSVSICETTGGWDCDFPFTYKVFPLIQFVFLKAKLCFSHLNRQGKTYNGCTTDNSSDGRAWCSTKTDEEGNHVDKKWGYCREHCGGQENPCCSVVLYFLEFQMACNSDPVNSEILGLCVGENDNYSTEKIGTWSDSEFDRNRNLACYCESMRNCSTENIVFAKSTSLYMGNLGIPVIRSQRGCFFLRLPLCF